MAGKGGKSQFSARHAFKVLCPESLVSSVIGPRGTTKDELQAETGCKIVVSNREEFYPGTRLRMLIIYGDSPQGLIQVLERIVHNVGQCAEKEQESPHFNPLESEFSGKEAGEFMLRAAIPTKASGAIIGPKGVNIQAIRNEFNARVFIEKSIEQGHQAIKLVASLDNMRHALLRINEAVQEEARTSELFRDWSSIRSFGEPGTGLQESAGVPHKGSDYGKGSGKPPKGGGKRRERSRSPRRDGGQHSMFKALATALADFPEGTLEEEFVLQCDLPRAKVSALIGKSGDHVRSVRKETRTRVNFDEAPGQDTQTMTIKGRMMDVYRAHSMMMRRYHDEDKEVQQVEVEKAAKVQGLQAQLADIQKQLAMVASAGGKGKGGKGKR